MKNQLSLKIKKTNQEQELLINAKPHSKKKLNFLSSIGLACLTFFTLTSAQAQDIKNQNNSSQTTVATIQEPFVVKGKVLDEFEPIPGVNIVLEGTKIGTITDFDGTFEFPKKLTKGDVLVFSYAGLESEKIVIENKDSALNIPLSINLKLDPIVIMGEVAVKAIYKSNRK